MRKRLLSMLLCGALVSTSLMGCGSKAGTTDQTPAADTKTEAGATEAPATQAADRRAAGPQAPTPLVDGRNRDGAVDLPGASRKLLYGNGRTNGMNPIRISPST